MPVAEASEPNVEQTGSREARHPLYQATHKLFLAGVGAVLLSKQEIQELAGQLVERGELAEKNRHMRLREKYKGRAEEFQQRRAAGKKHKQAASAAGEPAADFSASDLAALNEKLNVLSKQIDDLSKKWE